MRLRASKCIDFSVLIEALRDCVLLWFLLLLLEFCWLLDGLEHWGSLSREWCLFSRSDQWIVWGFEPTSWEITKGITSRLLIACGSPSCIGCTALGYGFIMWYQLAREHPSACIAITRTSMPASKWTSVKKLLCERLIAEASLLIFLIYPCMIGWLVHLLYTDGIKHPLYLLYLHSKNYLFRSRVTSVARTFT